MTKSSSDVRAALKPFEFSGKRASWVALKKLLPDVDIAVINGNFALDNGLVPSKDALVLESGEGNPYSNILAWNTEEDADKLAAVKKLDELLHTPEVADYIKKTWPDGEVIPAF